MTHSLINCIAAKLKLFYCLYNYKHKKRAHNIFHSTKPNGNYCRGCYIFCRYNSSVFTNIDDVNVQSHSSVYLNELIVLRPNYACVEVGLGGLSNIYQIFCLRCKIKHHCYQCDDFYLANQVL